MEERLKVFIGYFISYIDIVQYNTNTRKPKLNPFDKCTKKFESLLTMTQLAQGYPLRIRSTPYQHL